MILETFPKFAKDNFKVIQISNEWFKCYLCTYTYSLNNQHVDYEKHLNFK